MSWRKIPPHYVNDASGVVRNLVAAHRETGVKTFAALDLIAPQLDMQPRRVRRLFELDREPLVDLDEYTRILFRGARLLRRLADRLRERAERWESEADLLELKHRQLTLGEGKEWAQSNCGKRPLKRVA